MKKKLFLCVLMSVIFYSCEYRQGYIRGSASNFENSKLHYLAKLVKLGNVSKVEDALKLNDYDINELSPIGKESLLLHAVYNDDYEMVSCLMRHGADPFQVTGGNGWSPMRNAISNCKTKCLEEMIKHGRFDTISEFNAFGAIEQAYGRDCDSALELLKKAGVHKLDPGFIVYSSLCVYFNCKKNERESIELMELGLTFDDSLPIKRPDLIRNEEHKGKTISQIIRDEEILLSVEVIEYLKKEKGVDVMRGNK
jgi:ankyrin repeat protein